MTIIWFASSDLFGASNTGSIIEALLKFFFPTLAQSTIDTIHFSFRKAAHVLAYATLSYFYLIGFSQSWVNKQFKKDALTIATVLTFTLTWATLDELHQTYTQTRIGTPKDVAWDMFGACTLQIYLLLNPN